MEICIIILKEEELFDKLAKELTENDIKNITVLESNTLVSDLSNKKSKKDIKIFGSIRSILDYFNDESKLILIPLKSDLLDTVKKILKANVADSSYLLFTIPIANVEGKLS